MTQNTTQHGPETQPETETPATPVEPKPDQITTVGTITSGAVHGTRVEMFQVLAGSTIPVTDDSWVRASPSEEYDDKTEFTIGIDADEINAVDRQDGNDVYISSPTEHLFMEPDSTKITERVLIQSPYQTRDIFEQLRYRGDFVAEYTNNYLPKNQVDTEYLDQFITAFLDNGYSVVMKLGTANTLFDTHHSYTLDDGQMIITDEARIDPDHYDTKTTCPENGHGKGGNPHRIKYYLKRGECPVEGCEYKTELFRSLRGHIGGKCAGGCEDHENLNLRLAEAQILSEESAGDDFE